MLNAMYNNNYQIVQTPKALIIVAEMVHDARIVPILKDKAAAQAAHRPATLDLWLGDSVGWWEGDTLVVETINVNRTGARGHRSAPEGQGDRALHALLDKQMFYEFEVDDPLSTARRGGARSASTLRPTSTNTPATKAITASTGSSAGPATRRRRESSPPRAPASSARRFPRSRRARVGCSTTPQGAVNLRAREAPIYATTLTPNECRCPKDDRRKSRHAGQGLAKLLLASNGGKSE